MNRNACASRGQKHDARSEPSHGRLDCVSLLFVYRFGFWFPTLSRESRTGGSESQASARRDSGEVTMRICFRTFLLAAGVVATGAFADDDSKSALERHPSGWTDLLAKA